MVSFRFQEGKKSERFSSSKAGTIGERGREKGAGEDTNCIFSTRGGAGEEDRTDIGRTLG